MQEQITIIFFSITFVFFLLLFLFCLFFKHISKTLISHSSVCVCVCSKCGWTTTLPKEIRAHEGFSFILRSPSNGVGFSWSFAIGATRWLVNHLMEYLQGSKPALHCPLVGEYLRPPPLVGEQGSRLSSSSVVLGVGARKSSSCLLNS